MDFFLHLIYYIYTSIAKYFLLFFAELRAHKTGQILDPRKMLRVIVLWILHVKQIDMFVPLHIRWVLKEESFLFASRSKHVDEDVIEIFKFF